MNNECPPQPWVEEVLRAEAGSFSHHHAILERYVMG